MFKSRIVTDDGFYQIDFTGQGISLTKISKEETNELPYLYWVYLFATQHLEGTDIHNYKRVTPEIKLFSSPETTHNCDFKQYIGLQESYKVCECGRRK